MTQEEIASDFLDWAFVFFFRLFAQKMRRKDD